MSTTFGDPVRTPLCDDERRRRADVANHPTLNGIDFVDVDPADRRRLVVRFLKPVPANGLGLPAAPRRVRVLGGVRVVDIRVVDVARTADDTLVVTVDRPGDHSPYELAIDSDRLDPVLRRARFSFLAGCRADLDCRVAEERLPVEEPGPALDYLAKDYASFRRLLLDLLPQLDPDFTERSPADLGIALIELLAFTGDRLSYLQDAVANEAYLDTARRRISARRHAKLVDYVMHDGRNAWTALHVRVEGAGPFTLPQATPVLVWIAEPFPGDGAPPPPGIDASERGAPGGTPQDFVLDVLGLDPGATVVFETSHPAELRAEHDELAIHTWGDEECSLPAGTTELHLYARRGAGEPVVAPALVAGDRLLLEEIKGPATGAPADADPLQRAVVRIVEAATTVDPLYTDTPAPDGEPVAWTPAGGGDTDPAPLPLLRLRWAPEEATAFPLCVSTRLPDVGLVRDVTVARGNVVLADHGLTVDRELTDPAEPVSPDAPFRLRLRRGPLTMQCAPAEPVYDDLTGRLASPRTDLACDVREARPSVALRVDFPTGPDLWTPVPDLLDSPPFAREFVVELDDDGRAVLRFGDGEYGREVAGAIGFRPVYRVGNGRAGNVGAESLGHVVLPGAAGWLTAVRNPLPARGGEDPETIEEVRQHAPRVFRSEQLRAVTEADYVTAALRLAGLQGAVATFRWTGSRPTAVVAVDPTDPDGLENLPDGRTRLAPALEQRLRAHLSRFRLAGHDLELRAPHFVALELDVEVCAAPGHFRADVARAVRDVLSSSVLPDGRRGFFHPDNLTFGEPVFLSRVYAAVERVEGVDSALVTRFRRLGEPDYGELEAGAIAVGADEIARLDNDPDFSDHGVLRVTARGGKA
jgi:hypothetical protein